FSSRRRHTRFSRDWSSDVCSSDLLAAGHAYEAEGHVLFAVDTYPAYGRLSGRAKEDMIAGARVEVAPYKRDPADFVLWKPSSARSEERRVGKEWRDTWSAWDVTGN